MSVKAYDVNADFVLVAWKPPNTVNEAAITGYFVDRLVSGLRTVSFLFIHLRTAHEVHLWFVSLDIHDLS